MKRLLPLVALAGTCLALPEHARADVIVRLKSGTELYTSHTWTENGLVKFEHRGGVVGFPADAIESVTEAKPRNVDAPIARAARPARDTSNEATATLQENSESGAEAVADAQHGATPDQSLHGKSGEAPVGTVAPPSAQVPEVKGEDLTTRMQRLDDLSMKTHRELSVARSRGDPPEVVDALQAKVDEINRQRAATDKSLRSIH